MKVNMPYIMDGIDGNFWWTTSSKPNNHIFWVDCQLGRKQALITNYNQTSKRTQQSLVFVVCQLGDSKNLKKVNSTVGRHAFEWLIWRTLEGVLCWRHTHIENASLYIYIYHLLDHTTNYWLILTIDPALQGARKTHYATKQILLFQTSFQHTRDSNIRCMPGVS